MKKYIPYIIAVLIGSTISLAAQNYFGTPNQIRVRTDATGALLALAVSSTTPISQPTLFSNTRLRVDANNNLIIVCDTCGGGGGAPVDATYITQTANATLTNEQPLSLLGSGVLFSTTSTGVVTSLGQGLAGQAIIAGTPPAFGSTYDSGAITADTPFQITQEWNNSGVTFTGLNVTVTQTASEAHSLLFKVGTPGCCSGTHGYLDIQQDGTVYVQSAFQLGAGANFSTDNGGYTHLTTADLSGVMQMTAPNAGELLLKSGSDGAYIESIELAADPTPPAATRFQLYAKDNGGKVTLYAQFPTGSPQAIAAEP